MVILVVSAMASTSKLLYPYLNNGLDENIRERYREISKYMLLNVGEPENWGQNSQVTPETFGLAKAGAFNAYELDVDKVSRLNSENLYALSYADIFLALKISDVSFRIEIKPIFEVSINLTASFNETDSKIYQFEILTEKHGSRVQANLKCYIIAENYFNTTDTVQSSGRTSLNITLSNNINGPALLIVLAKSIYEQGITSFNAYAFTHNSAEPHSKGTFLKLSPVNYNLTASFQYSEIVLQDAYALTFNYNSSLTQTGNNNQSATYNIPRFRDSSPIIIVVTGQNSTDFFIEWTAYPQIPFRIGADFSNSQTLSNVFSYTYTVSIDSALYQCNIWLGGPNQ